MSACDHHDHHHQTRNEIGESVLCVFVNRGWAVFVGLFSFCISIVRNVSVRFILTPTPGSSVWDRHPPLQLQCKMQAESSVMRHAPCFFTPKTQGHWDINKTHWQWQLAKLTNGACLFKKKIYIPMVRATFCILTPDSINYRMRPPLSTKQGPSLNLVLHPVLLKINISKKVSKIKKPPATSKLPNQQTALAILISSLSRTNLSLQPLVSTSCW